MLRPMLRTACLSVMGAVGLVTTLVAVQANEASPFPIEVRQPDGTPIRLFLRGNEKLSWYEYVPEAVNMQMGPVLTQADMAMASTPGYTVVRDEDGRYVYATLDAGAWAPTAQMVGRDAPPETRRIMPPPPMLEQMMSQRLPEMRIPSGRTSASGTVRNLVILMRFADHVDRPLPTPADYDVLFNAPAPDPQVAPTGSVQGFYRENSYGKLQLQSTIVGWITLPRTEAYYADRQSGLTARITEAIRDALRLVSSQRLVDFRDFDNENGGVGDGWIDAITFVHSGYAAEFGGVAGGAAERDRIWSHRWEISPWTDPTSGVKVSNYNINPGIWGTRGHAIGRIGVICHELGHFFGLPDLYDYSQTGSGIGSWCLMANSWGFDGSQLHPPHLSAWCKLALSWNSTTTLTAPGLYSTEPTTSPGAKIYRINYAPGSPNEYLLIENRQPVGEFDGGIPAGTAGRGGLLVWHIDDAVLENNMPGYPGSAGYPAAHYRVALIQADGRWDLERGRNRGDGDDPFRPGWVDALSGDTTPSSRSYSDIPPEMISQISANGSSMQFYFGITPQPLSQSSFARHVRIQSPESHSVNFSPDGKVATLIFDQLQHALGKGETRHTVTAAWTLPLQQTAAGTVMKLRLDGYANVDQGNTVSIIIVGGGALRVIDPRDHKVEPVDSAGQQRPKPSYLAQQSASSQETEPPHGTTSFNYTYHLEELIGDAKQYTATVILVTSKSQADESSAHIVVDSLELELAP
jgi:M6 family metalloprotease-like protein